MNRRLLSTARLSFPLLAALAALLVAPAAHATPYYWDNTNTTSGFGSGGGTWQVPTAGTLTSGWSTSSTGVATVNGNSITTTTADLINFGTDSSTFGYGGGTITVVGTVQASGIRFGSQTTTSTAITGGTIDLAAAATLHVGAGGTTVHTISSNITGASTSLTKTGNTLRLSGSNSYTGSTIISSGTLILNNASALGTTSGISMSAGTTLRAELGITTAAPITLSGTGNITIANGTTTAVTANYNGGITGTTTTLTFSVGNNTSNPAHVISLGATSNYTGNTIITAGDDANALTVRSGAVNALSPTTALSFGNIVGSGSGRSLTFDLNGNNQTLAGLSQPANIPNDRNYRVGSTNAATLTINNTSNFSYGGANVDVGASAPGTVTSAQITGAISLVKNGTGTFTLGGNLTNAATAQGNTFTGSTTVLAGVLVLGESVSIRNSAFDTAGSIAGDATNGLRTSVTTLTLGGLTGGNDFSTRFTTTSGGYTGLTALTLNPGTGATPSYSGDVGNGNGSMTLTKGGAGTQTLTVAQTYSGGTNINNGTLALGGTGTLGASGTALNLGGGSLNLGTLSQTVGAVSVTAAATGVDTILNGSLTGTSYASTSTTGTAIISANLLVNGAAGFALSGAGSVTLSGNNTYTGGTSVTSTGALNLVHSSAAGTNTISLSSTQTSTGATLTLSGGIDVANGIVIDALTGRENILSLSGSNTLSGNITINNNAGNFIVFSNNGAAATTFTVGGATPNSTTLTGSTYSSTISFRANGGTDRLGVLNSQINVPNATVDFNNAGNWTINSTGNSWLTTQISSAAGAIVTLGASDVLDTGALLNFSSASGTGLLDMNGKNQSIAGVAGGNTTTPTVHISNSGTADSTLTLAGLTANRSFAGIIADGATNKVSLVMDSAGRTQTLTGANTYTGATTVNAGTLLVGVSGVGSITSDVTVKNTATLGGSGTVGNVTVETGGTVAPGNSPGILSSNNITTTGGTYIFEIDGLTAGDGTGFHDQLSVTGTVNLGSSVALATIIDLGGYVPTGSDMFFLIRNDGSDPINGQFSNISEGTPVMIGGIPFYATYTANAEGTPSPTGGNDFALVPEPGHWALALSAGGLLLLRRNR